MIKTESNIKLALEKIKYPPWLWKSLYDSGYILEISLGKWKGNPPSVPGWALTVYRWGRMTFVHRLGWSLPTYERLAQEVLEHLFSLREDDLFEQPPEMTPKTTFEDFIARYLAEAGIEVGETIGKSTEKGSRAPSVFIPNAELRNKVLSDPQFREILKIDLSDFDRTAKLYRYVVEDLKLL